MVMGKHGIVPLSLLWLSEQGSAAGPLKTARKARGWDHKLLLLLFTPSFGFGGAAIPLLAQYDLKKTH